MIKMIAAASRNGVIGRNGQIPWHLRDDLRRFKTITTGHRLIMGRKTFESVGVLPDRISVVVTRSYPVPKNAVGVSNLRQALDFMHDAFIIGGGEIYQQSLPFVDRIYLTQVEAEIDGDTYFPALNNQEWELVDVEKHLADAHNEYNYSFLTLNRIHK